MMANTIEIHEGEIWETVGGAVIEIGTPQTPSVFACNDGQYRFSNGCVEGEQPDYPGSCKQLIAEQAEWKEDEYYFVVQPVILRQLQETDRKRIRKIVVNHSPAHHRSLWGEALIDFAAFVDLPDGVYEARWTRGELAIAEPGEDPKLYHAAEVTRVNRNSTRTVQVEVRNNCVREDTIVDVTTIADTTSDTAKQLTHEEWSQRLRTVIVTVDAQAGASGGAAGESLFQVLKTTYLDRMSDEKTGD